MILTAPISLAFSAQRSHAPMRTCFYACTHSIVGAERVSARPTLAGIRSVRPWFHHQSCGVLSSDHPCRYGNANVDSGFRFLNCVVIGCMVAVDANLVDSYARQFYQFTRRSWTNRKSTHAAGFLACLAVVICHLLRRLFHDGGIHRFIQPIFAPHLTREGAHSRT